MTNQKEDCPEREDPCRNYGEKTGRCFRNGKKAQCSDCEHYEPVAILTIKKEGKKP